MSDKQDTLTSEAQYTDKDDIQTINNDNTYIPQIMGVPLNTTNAQNTDKDDTFTPIVGIPLNNTSNTNIPVMPEMVQRLNYYLMNIRNNYMFGQLAIDIIQQQINLENALIEEIRKITAIAKQEQDSVGRPNNEQNPFNNEQFSSSVMSNNDSSYFVSNNLHNNPNEPK